MNTKWRGRARWMIDQEAPRSNGVQAARETHTEQAARETHIEQAAPCRRDALVVERPLIAAVSLADQTND